MKWAVQLAEICSAITNQETFFVRLIMSRSGTLVICVQNLDFSGANQVVLNVVSGRVHQR